jgi:hypothetical protein
MSTCARRTRPPQQLAEVLNAVLDGKARLSDCAFRLRVMDAKLRNTLETTADRAAITRLTSAMTEIEGTRANLAALDGILTDLQRHFEDTANDHPA